MTFLEEIRELYSDANRKRKEQKSLEDAEYAKTVGGLAATIEKEIERCRDLIRQGSSSGQTNILLEFRMKDYPEIIAREVYNQFRKEGFNARSPVIGGFFRLYYTVEVFLAW